MLGKPDRALAVARKHLARGDASSALRILDELIAHDPFNPVARRLRANLLFARGEFEAAIEDVEVLTIVCRHDDEALALAGEAHLELGRPEKAREAYVGSISLNPLNRRALTGLLRLADKTVS